MREPNLTMLARAREPFAGSSNTTKTFSKTMYGLFVANDGASDLTVTVNGETFTVKTGKEFREYFDAFTTCTITTTVAFRAYGLG